MIKKKVCGTGGPVMRISDRYELLTVRAEDEECKTFEACEIGTGRSVLVHLLLHPRSEPADTALLDLVIGRARSGGSDNPILELQESAEGAYVVTEVPSHFRSLRRWMEGSEASIAGQGQLTKAGKWRVPQTQTPTPEVKSESSSAPEPGEFTRLFQTANPPVETELTSSALPGPPGEAPEPREFTQMFQTQKLSSAADAGTTPQPEIFDTQQFQPQPHQSRDLPENPSQCAKEQVDSATEEQPGEFTQLFQAPTAGTAQPESMILPETTRRTEPSGEFTRMFEPASPEPVGQDAEPGAFTRMFQAPLRDPQQAVTPTVSGEGDRAGEFTRMFDQRAQKATAAQPGAPAGNLGSVPQPPQAGDFTRLFRQGTSPSHLAGSPETPGEASLPAFEQPGRLGPPAFEPPVQRASNATRIFTAPDSPPAPGPDPALTGPSEFTRVIATPQADTLTPAEPAQGGAQRLAPEDASSVAPVASEQTQTSRGSKSSYLPLIIIMNVLLLAAITLILYFAFSR